MERRVVRGRPARILLVEDNNADIRLTQETLRESKVRNEMHVVRDGEEALTFLRRKPPHEAAPRPDLVLLDLNLPRLDGRQVLAAIKADARLKAIPVVVLTTSSADRDIIESYNLHANCYITKPVDLEQFISVVRSIERFWFETVTLPPSLTK
jgi:CheY-like chemotaxis protein